MFKELQSTYATFTGETTNASTNHSRAMRPLILNKLLYGFSFTTGNTQRREETRVLYENALFSPRAGLAKMEGGTPGS
jgi:hypothetical protein